MNDEGRNAHKTRIKGLRLAHSNNDNGRVKDQRYKVLIPNAQVNKLHS